MDLRPITSTYRLQLRGPKADEQGRAFTFADAAELVPYLAKLGISHLYLSPILTSVPESNHGYDVIDPTTVNPELGGMTELQKLADVAHKAGLGIIIDLVPNHLGVDDPQANAWWWDVLTYGQDSQFEPYFDIDWHEDNGAGGKMGLPVLGSADDIDKLELDTSGDEPLLRYYDNVFPVRPGTEDGTPQEVHDRQSYRLMFWRDGIIGYRRFFSVNGLAGIRQEHPVVFEHTHRVVRELIAADIIDGIRIDHPDGLSDPFAYLTELRRLLDNDKWLVIEKILGSTEPLDPRLAVDGTTGYDALFEYDNVFINRESRDQLSMLALQQSGSTWDEQAVSATERALKYDAAKGELAAEVRRLARALRRDNWSTGGANVDEELLIDTICQLVAAMPVYRADYESLSRVTSTVIAEMVVRFPSRVFALDLISAGLIAHGEAATRFAQVCGAVMAKGVEDTTFYRACRLVSTQEVGGDPGRYGMSSAEYHLLQSERARLWPKTMTTLSTHDTKRGEDVRARITQLSDVAGDWSENVRSWLAVTPAPDDATGYFLLQNIIGVWPADGEITDELRQRLHDYAIKAMREAGQLTTWTEPNEDLELAIRHWIDALLDGPVTDSITEFVRRIAPAGWVMSWGRKLLQLAGPGVPDTYQGTEFIEDSLVDPDNRRFVDYAARRSALDTASNNPAPTAVHPEHADALPEGFSADDADQVKLMVTHGGLAARKERPESFIGGSYQPVFAEGTGERFLVGCARGPKNEPVDVIALTTRRPIGLAAAGGWGDTTVTLPEGYWTDTYTGRTFSGTLTVAHVFSNYPFALLISESDDN
ncbi:malto-oligosyltrehalose synthase [Corynebacterium sp. TAE3-ERU12]|uniref:malto-oligosyltrehalose synthase n=1 Tax=Corynebacterium sp. TAE3-ERU12 TaxID=2849491 RepID=UPI001C43AAFA|nr:malto-oligosyltrehalose synthase [Corynebacterium sp. TAE3-ERU12]MBV7296193.1 malto-oligosyltrehalose synthase [Corynebacterium sp. TAE3-ERU12]